MAEVALPEIRLPWHNPHDRPSDAALIAHYLEPLPELVRAARAAMTAPPEGTPALHEALAWRGLPWRWSWAYELHPDTDPQMERPTPQRALAYLVPAVVAPELCVPLTYEQYEAMPKGVATTFVRQGITLAREIGDCRWVEWTITQQAQLDEVLAVIRHKIALLAGKPARGG